MPENIHRHMEPSEIPTFVDEVIESGCDITAVGHDSYVIGDADEQDSAIETLDRIQEKYGNPDPLKLEIVNYLWSVGRFLELASENSRH
ncbi:hypothetical protein [Ensifer adhaerens]|uniref:hypothetical protein n=1 Tax=Ensifer adhaerens TaxID=106592 RepID=UPI001CC08432|nr:hypothetical protein [Ensifer adhaerens]MBZ7920533.1 hypothetical protein [Ensifer adhaerens]